MDNEIPSLEWFSQMKIPATDQSDEYQSTIENQQISFVFAQEYLYQECELGKLNKNSKKLIQNFCDIQKKTFQEAKNDINKMKKVSRSWKKHNEYSQLFSSKFKQVESDFYEIFWWDTSRAFWYFINNIFHIVLVKNRHLETKK